MTDHSEPTPQRQPPTEPERHLPAATLPRRSASETLARALGTAGATPTNEHARAEADDGTR